MAKQHRRLKRTTLIAVACVVFLGSVGFARTGHTQALGFAWPAVTLIGLLLFGQARLAVFIAMGLVLGMWRGSAYMDELNNYQALYEQKVTLVATAQEDGTYGFGGQVEFMAGNVQINGQKLKGKVVVSGYGVNSVYQGDQIVATGKLRSGYGGVQGTLRYAKLEFVKSNPSLIINLRREFTAGVANALPEPLASFAMGILVGQRANLPDEVKDDLKTVGLTHIIAVSGANLTIMLRAAERLFKKQSRRLSYGFALAFIGVFLVIAGGSASIVRAAIVSMLSLGAAYYGRSFKPLNLILLAAAITAMANPFYVWGDMSWYLSFLAFNGVLMVSPIISARLYKGKEAPLLIAVAIETLSAEVMTLPIVMHQFGQASLVGLPANMLVVTLVPLGMLLSLIAGLAGMLIPTLAGWLAWPAVVILNFMLDTAHLIAGLPNVFVQNIDFGLSKMLFAYAATAVVITLLTNKTNKQHRAKITERTAVT